ncbi:copper amine oxidase [Paenibacillus terrae]|uniref:copper amine oxidase n=1 Tax=Paenibacillus terrae TaxID=159743 RepID=UPI0011EB62B1|nr:copper amine oxidase [Paenibacillus terrae]
MFKLLIVILLSMLLSSSGMISGHPSPDPVPEPIQSRPLAVAPEDSSVKLYVMEPSQGLFRTATLEIGQQRRAFAWSGSSDIVTAPQLYYTDVNGDGVREAVVILTLASGTGVELQELHIVNAQTMDEYPVESAADAVSRRVHSSVELRDHNQQVHIAVKIDGITHTLDPKASAFYDDPAHFTDHLDFSSVVMYDAEQRPLHATVSGSVSPTEFVGDLELKYVYEHGRFRVGPIEFAASSPF